MLSIDATVTERGVTERVSMNDICIASNLQGCWWRVVKVTRNKNRA
jgi:hypothetical protein